MNNELEKAMLQTIGAAGEKGIDSVDLLAKFPDDTNASDVYQVAQHLRDNDFIRFNVRYRRIPYGGGKVLIQRCIATNKGIACLAELQKEGLQTA